MTISKEAIEAMRPHIEKLKRCVRINDEMRRVVTGQTEAITALAEIFDNAESALSTLPIAGEGRWLPIAQADRTITDVQDFSEVGITLRNSDRYWVRDTDGRVYEASWTDDKDGYWWDWEAESPVDPIEFMPHPLDPRFSALISSPGKDGGQEMERPAPMLQVVGWLYEDELPVSYPYNTLFPFSKVDGVRMFPVYAPSTSDDSTALVERLTKALEPFAAEAAELAEGVPDDCVYSLPRFPDLGLSEFDVGDLRAARFALSASTSREGESR